jgi:S-formylglutathione hydrolase FrmB
MRTLELIVLILSVSLLIGSFFKLNKNHLYVSGLLVLFVILYAIFEGLRYEVFMMLILIGLSYIPFKPLLKLRRFLIIFIISILFLLMLAFPVYTMPTPTGTYDVGTKTYQVNDLSRNEIYGNQEGIRKFNFQIWYPFIKTDEHDLAPWLLDQEITSQALSRDFGFPGFLLNQTQFVTSHSYLDADFTEEKMYPIVIISHGWSGTKYLHSDLGENLASQGFIAVSIEHTYGAVASVIDGEVISKQEDALTGFADSTSNLASNTRLMMTYGLDVIATIDFLETLNFNPNDIFYNHLDLNQIGAVGHSTGGGGIIYAALHDNRIQAIIGLDAWVEPIQDFLDEKTLAIPSLFLRSEAWEERPNNDVLIPMLQNATSETQLYRINETTHYDFAMVYMYTSLAKTLGFSGSISTENMIEIMFTSHESFFNEHLKNKNEDLTWISNDYVDLVDYN